MINPKLGPVLEDMKIGMKEVSLEFSRIGTASCISFCSLQTIFVWLATPSRLCGAMGALLLSLAYKKLTLPKLQEAC